MAFKRRPPGGWPEEEDTQLKETLEKMATLNDLFGSGEKKAKVVNLKVVGEFVKGVVKEIDTTAPVFEWDTANNKIGFQKFWVNGKPKGVAESDAKQAGLNPVHQIMVTIETAEGEVRVPFNNKDEREKLKEAIIANDGSISPGDILGKRLTERVGNIKTHEVKLHTPEAGE